MPKKLKKLYLNAGQMKAGTTYLFDILRPHREVFFSPEKEIHHLSQTFGNFRILSDATRLRKGKSIAEIANKLDRPIQRYQETMRWISDYLRPPETEGWYEDMFKGHREDQWVADFSNLTCTIPVPGLHKVANLADDVRVTYCIRNTVSRAISHAKFHLRFAGENPDLASISENTLKNLLLSDNIFPQSQSEAHISALHEVFGDERLRIIRCESLWKEPRQVANNLCDFLDIEPMKHDISREVVNPGPKSEMNDAVMEVFQEIFGDLQEKQDALLNRHANIVIG
jgi:hypothetical protein